jgi:hypothetical protein
MRDRRHGWGFPCARAVAETIRRPDKLSSTILSFSASLQQCIRRPFLNNSSPGQAVYEPFMGSGTTLIAAETTGRVCLGIELNPAYVDVAVERWQRFTGKAVMLDGADQTLEDLKATRA